MQSILVVQADDIQKREFYKHTYLHLAAAIGVFMIVEALFLRVVPSHIISAMISAKTGWLLILGLFWLGSTLTNKLSFSPSVSLQYLGLSLYILLEAILFLPMIYIAVIYAGKDVINQAAIITLSLFIGLTALAFKNKTDFSFLKKIIVVGGMIALGLIIAGMLFNFNLGLWFSVGMVVLGGASILYQTQELQHIYQTNQYVGAAMKLFASIMLIFWYVLRILMSLNRRN